MRNTKKFKNKEKSKKDRREEGGERQREKRENAQKNGVFWKCKL